MFDSREQTRAPVRATGDPSADDRLLVARLHRIALDYAGGYREGLSRAAALAELAEFAADPDLLAQAAAIHAVDDTWYAINAVDLLLEAGAPAQLVNSHLDATDPGNDSTLTDPERLPEAGAG